jgi:hypothetical protein
MDKAQNALSEMENAEHSASELASTLDDLYDTSGKVKGMYYKVWDQMGETNT